MVFALLGFFLLAGFAALFVLALRALGTRRPATRRGRILLGAFALLTVLLLGRPDEQIEGGEDPGAYFNVAHALVQRNALRFEDPALAAIAPEERRLFRYGHPGFLLTKDAVLWADGPEMKRVGVFFPPAYSILLALPVGLGLSYGVYALTSLLAVGCGVLVAGMARRIGGFAAAPWCAYALFLLHPAVAWNARALRAEWLAAFLALAGLALWIQHATRPDGFTWKQGLAAGLALGSAPLFHMTAIYVLAPTLFFSLPASRRSGFWLAWWGGVVTGILLLVWQTRFVTDPYFLRITFANPKRAGLFLAMAAAGGTTAALLRFLIARFQPGAGAWRRVSLLAVLASLALLAFLWTFRDENGRVPVLPAWTAAYLSFTDVRGLARLMSGAALAAALLGWFPLVAGSAFGRWVFALLAPASLTIGWVVNYMFETRRMVAFLAPLLTLGTLSLIGAGLRRLSAKPWREAVAVLAILPLLGSMAWGRLPLYRTWNNRGAHGFYRDLAGRIAPEADFLLAEYTQTAVPLASLGALPLLPMAWEYRDGDEVRQIEAVWQRLLADHPERRHVLVSPFGGAAVPGAGLEPLFSEGLRVRRLERARRDVPRALGRWTRTLHVQRLLPPGSTAPRVPFAREFPGSRLGLRGVGSPMGPRATPYRGVRLDVEDALTLPNGHNGELVLMVAYPHGAPDEDPWVSGASLRRTRAGSSWDLWHLRREGSESIRLRTRAHAFLAEAFSLGTEGPTPIPLPDGTPFVLEKLDSQWLRAEAAVLAPAHAGESWLWIHAQHSRTDPDPVNVRVAREDGSALGEIPIGGGWRWHGLRLRHGADATGACAWMRLDCESAYDPGSPDFRADLGFRIHQLVLVPGSAP